MRLRALSLRSFKKFADLARLDDIGDGLNVVAGPNEMGKSTLFDAIHAALFERHGSQAKPIEALQNDRMPAGPTVSLTFEQDDKTYRIEKRFLRKPYARLICSDGGRLEGDQAEEELQSLLGFSQSGRVGAKPETLGMWSVLWVRQGSSFGPFPLPETARASLQGALVSEVGDVLGGRRGRALLEVIAGELGAFVTTNGRPRGDYKGLLAQRDELDRGVAMLKARRSDLAQAFDELDEAERKHSELTAGVRDHADEAELAAARVHWNERTALEARIEAALGEVDLSKRDVAQAEAAVIERKKLKDACQQAETSVTDAAAKCHDAMQRQADAQAALASLRTMLDAAERAADDAEVSAARQQRIAKLVDRAEALDALKKRCAAAQEAEAQRRTAMRAANAILVTEPLLTRIRSASHELEKANAQLSARATAVSFAIDPAALADFTVDRRSLERADHVLHVTERTEIAISGRGTIIIEPAIQNREKLTARRRDSEKDLAGALREAGVQDLDEASRQYAAREKSLQDAKLAAAEVALHVPAGERHDAGVGSDALAEYVQTERDVLTAEMVTLSLTGIPSRDTTDAVLAAAELASTTARGAARIARAQVSAPEEALRELATAMGAAKARLDDGIRARNERLESYRAAEATLPEATLATAISAAHAKLETACQALAALEAQRTDETLAQLKARISRLESALQERRKKRLDLEVKIAELRSRIGVYADGGIDEDLARKRREQARCQRECDAVAEEVEVLTLLRDMLRAAERDAKERYLSPIVRRVEPYLQAMFPGAGIAIDENLGITGLVRAPGYQETFRQLSLGTQEQIAVLVRLAFAEMLVEQGHPASVILDDALVFSDDHRMKLMFDILTMAARKVQIVVLTCREQLFEGLGAHALTLRRDDREETRP